MDAVAGTQTAFPSLRVEEVGERQRELRAEKSFSRDFANAERMTIPITLLILLAAFGSLVAACLPVVLAFSAVLASLGLYALVTHGYSGDYQSTSAVILLIGMAVGVDYSLFYLRREREERQAGQEPRPALLRAASTSGQAVLISGATVLVAMAGMLIAGNKIFTSMALGTMLVVLCAVVGSLTVLPAALAKLGDRIDRGRVPYIGRRKQAAGDSRFWAFVLSRVLQPPAPLGRARRRAAAPRRVAAPEHAHEAAGLHRHAQRPADRQDVRARDHRVPRRADSGGGRDPGRRRAEPGRGRWDPEPRGAPRSRPA